MGKVLVIAAHPDDEVLGCGATIARLVNEGYHAYTLILGEGVTSRDETRDVKKREDEIKELRKQTCEANKIIGIKKVFTHDFPDNRFDTVSLLDIVKVIERVKKETGPDIIFTHYERDLNIDHQITYKAVITATRPSNRKQVNEIYSFEVLSSTEWYYPLSFLPDVFFDIAETLQYKLEALEVYASEVRKFPYPRSLEGIKSNAKYWGVRVGKEYVEAFKIVRILR